MNEIVLRLDLKAGAEAEAFGRFVTGFVERCDQTLSLAGAESATPLIIIHADPNSPGVSKVVIFEEEAWARAFAREWEAARQSVVFN